jgi:hypothetical protein
MSWRWFLLCRAGRRCADVVPIGEEARWPAGLRISFTCGTCGTNYEWRAGRRHVVRSTPSSRTVALAYGGSVCGEALAAGVLLALGHAHLAFLAAVAASSSAACWVYLLWRRRRRRGRANG